MILHRDGEGTAVEIAAAVGSDEDVGGDAHRESGAIGQAGRLDQRGGAVVAVSDRVSHVAPAAPAGIGAQHQVAGTGDGWLRRVEHNDLLVAVREGAALIGDGPGDEIRAQRINRRGVAGDDCAATTIGCHRRQREDEVGERTTRVGRNDHRRRTTDRRRRRGTHQDFLLASVGVAVEVHHCPSDKIGAQREELGGIVGDRSEATVVTANRGVQDHIGSPVRPGIGEDVQARRADDARRLIIHHGHREGAGGGVAATVGGHVGDGGGAHWEGVATGGLADHGGHAAVVRGSEGEGHITEAQT